MRCFLAVLFAAGLLSTPMLATAQDTFPLGPTPIQILTAVAQLEAQANARQSGQSLACATVFSSPRVETGQTVDLAWGSVGALDPELATTTRSMWRPTGGSVLSFRQAGTWTYSFTFYNAQGATATCSAQILVTK